jgi:hypothetical protein
MKIVVSNSIEVRRFLSCLWSGYSYTGPEVNGYVLYFWFLKRRMLKACRFYVVSWNIRSLDANSYCLGKTWMDLNVLLWNQWRVWDEKDDPRPLQGVSTPPSWARSSGPLSSSIQPAAIWPLSRKPREFKIHQNLWRTITPFALQLLESE